jgi:hypothetical protein
MERLSARQLDGILGGIVGLGTILVLGALVLPGSPMTGPTALTLLVDRGWIAGLWILAALGLGTVSLSALPTDLRLPAFRLPLGVAILIVIDLVLGGLGLLGRGHETIAWLAVLAPAGLGIGVIARRRTGVDGPSTPPDDPWRLVIPLGIPIGVLLLAATSTPGWLWASEFGGYDALSYHLQLPREWWFAGGIVETPHNAYGYLPGGVSAAFLHVMTLDGDPSAAAISCQILVALLTIAAADATVTLATVWAEDADDAPRVVPRLAMLALVATPWVIVTGSLAYDEAVVMLATATAAALVMRASGESLGKAGDLRTGAILGVVLGAAVLAKASSGVLVVLPIAVLSAVLMPIRRWPLIVLGTLLGGVAVCLPWLLRQWSWTGNPVFPFAAGLFGAGDWSDERMTRFALGHASPGGIEAAAAIAREFLLDDLVGTLPSGEPWRPQWWWLPITGVVALLVASRNAFRASSSRRRGLAMLAAVAVAVIAWCLLTHAKARFLLAIAPILAAAIPVATASWRAAAPRRLLAAIAWLAALGPAVMFATERNGAPAAAIGGDEAFDGRMEAEMIAVADPNSARDLRAEASRAFILRDLPDDALVLMVGVADPFHLPVFREDGTPRLRYTTVWTRGPLETAFASAENALDETSAPDAAAIAGAALDILRADGFTHVLVAPTMLEIWRSSGWLDPMLEPDRIAALPTSPGVQVAHRFGDGSVLLSITVPNGRS